MFVWIGKYEIYFVTMVVCFGRVKHFTASSVLFFLLSNFFSFLKEIVGIGRKLGIDRLFASLLLLLWSSSRSDDDWPLAGGRVESVRLDGK